MPIHFNKAIVSLIVLSLLAISCQPKAPTGQSTQPAEGSTQAVEGASSTKAPLSIQNGEEPRRITGSFTYTNTIITTYYTEQMVALVDMYGFVNRDMEWKIPVDSQVVGYLQLNPEEMKGTYQIDLPEQPRGMSVDVDQDGQQDAGVQVFAASYWPNLIGSPYSTGDDVTRGWPNYLASVITDTENKDEVIGGKLVVWAPDAAQEFPTGYGADGLLFTADDPVGLVPAGYSIVDLDQQPFTVSQSAEPDLALYEPKDVAIKDYSSLSYSEAFKKMFDQVRLEYAFNDISGKAPDWDALWAKVEPEVAAAEQNQDSQAFYMALRDYIFAFNDGHVGLNGGDVENEVFSEAISGGYGFSVGETGDGQIVVIYLTPDGAAEKAGIKVGAQITAFNGAPIGDAIAAVQPLSAPFSTEFAKRYQQLRYLVRAPLGTSAEVTYINPNAGSPRAVTLDTTAETDSYSYTSVFRGFDANALPVEYKILDSGVGYVKINSNYDDLNLIIRLFERALKVFSGNQVTGIIIDLRENSGGANLGLAGFLTGTEIPLGQLEYYSEKAGTFEADGIRDRVTPYEAQYSFSKMALLVGQGCFSACEIEAYGFSQVPGMMVVGYTPTAGVEAEVARGQYTLPDGFFIQIPTGRFTLPDGSIFLEGQGVVPTITVPSTLENLLSADDVVLKTAETAILTPAGAGITPTGSPVVNTPIKSLELIQDGSATALEDLAREQNYPTSKAGDVYTYTVEASQSQPLLWANGWCAKDVDTLSQNLEHTQFVFTLNGTVLDLSELGLTTSDSGGMACQYYYTVLTDWPAGEHHLSVAITFDQPINDGNTDYPRGTHTYEYNVYIEP